MSQVEPVKPASVQNQATQHVSDMAAKLSLVAGSWLFHDEDDDDVNLWQLGLFAKIDYNSQGSVCNDNVAMFSLLGPIKIFQLNRPTQRGAWAISAHNQVCCLSSLIYPGAPDCQN